MSKVKHLCITPDFDDGGICVKLHCDSKIKAISYSVLCEDGKTMVRGVADLDAEKNTFSVALGYFIPWTIENPYLYTLTLSIIFYDGANEEILDTFGMRKLSVDSKNILLNNKPFYMRAYIRGTICHDHGNMCDLSEEEFYEKNILTAKSYGFNTIRFHSRIPPKACFRVSDRLGMFIHIEMRNPGEEYDNLKEMVQGNNIFVSDGAIRNIILNLMNHPSFMVYCIGNEIKHPGVNPEVRHIAELIKSIDSSRLFIDTCAHGEFDRDYVKFDVQHMSYYYPFGKHYNMFENTDNLLVYGSCTGAEMKSEGICGDGSYQITRGIEPTRPIIAHEVCHYTALRDIYNLEKKFEMYAKEKPWWIYEQKKMIEAKGLTERFPTMFRASKAFQFMSWKLGIEAIRRSPILSGFHMLQFADTDCYENSNGVVDCFDDISGVDRESFLRFNSDTVLLADLPIRAYFEHDIVNIPVLVSNFSQQEYGECVFEYELCDTETEEAVLSGKLHNINIEAHGRINICKLNLKFPSIDHAIKYRLTFCLRSCIGTVIYNEWMIWCFENKPQKLDVSNCAFRFKEINAAARYNAIAVRPQSGEPVYVTDILDDQVFDTLARGESVLLLYRAAATRHVRDRDAKIDAYSFRATWERFKAVIWDRGTNYGGIVNNPDVLSGFPQDGITDLQFYHLIEDSDKIILDDFPVPVTPIFECIDKSVRDRFDVRGAGFAFSEFQYDRTLRKFSYIMELKVGSGKLLVTGLNFTGLSAQTPETCAMFETLLRYVNSDKFAPKDEIEVEKLKEYLADNRGKGIVRERMMTQFWQLDDTPVESAEYWINSKEYILKNE